ncbi:MAG: porin family protein [Bacteroidales bacterium]|nr:porin family protein [Bacteroidales bacterium]
MKKIIIAIVAIFAMTTAANAQLSGIGVRLGGGQGYGAELSTLWNFGNRVEIDLGWASHDDITDFSLTGIYQWQGDIANGFGWFAGVGARLAYWSWEVAGASDSDIALALAGQAGLEYKFSAIPIQLSLDIRPAFYLIPDTHFHWGDIALGIRYIF